jgi:hypothetical protein
LAIDMLELGRFDYIDCCGVLHHLADPREGLLSLKEALGEDGGMGLMLYGELGRTGVYPLQRALRRLAGGEELPAQIALARRLIAELPESNWFRRNPFLADHLRGDDAGLVDLLLHARDRAYTVDGIARLCGSAGLRISGFVPPLSYDPAIYLKDADLKSKAAALPPLEAAALAEELAGSRKCHVFYVVREDNPNSGAAIPAGDLVPCLRETDRAELARALSRSPVLKLKQDGLSLRFVLPRAAADLVQLCDGGRTVDAIFAELQGRSPRLSRAAFDKLFADTWRVLHPLNILLFGGPNAPPRP